MTTLALAAARVAADEMTKSAKWYAIAIVLGGLVGMAYGFYDYVPPEPAVVPPQARPVTAPVSPAVAPVKGSGETETPPLVSEMERTFERTGYEAVNASALPPAAARVIENRSIYDSSPMTASPAAISAGNSQVVRDEKMPVFFQTCIRTFDEQGRPQQRSCQLYRRGTYTPGK